jgi:hypothetical protein
MADYYQLVLKTINKTKAKLLSGWVMFFYPIFATCHPDTAKVLLKSSEPKTKYNLGGAYRMLLPWLGMLKSFLIVIFVLWFCLGFEGFHLL